MTIYSNALFACERTDRKINAECTFQDATVIKVFSRIPKDRVSSQNVCNRPLNGVHINWFHIQDYCALLIFILLLNKIKMISFYLIQMTIMIWMALILLFKVHTCKT